MNKATDPVLEVLNRAKDLYLSRADINYNIQNAGGEQPSRQTVYRAFDDLVAFGLVEPKNGDRKRYTITEVGRQYLKEEIDASELERQCSEE